MPRIRLPVIRVNPYARIQCGTLSIPIEPPITTGVSYPILFAFDRGAVSTKRGSWITWRAIEQGWMVFVFWCEMPILQPLPPTKLSGVQRPSIIFLIIQSGRCVKVISVDSIVSGHAGMGWSPIISRYSRLAIFRDDRLLLDRCSMGNFSRRYRKARSRRAARSVWREGNPW